MAHRSLRGGRLARRLGLAVVLALTAAVAAPLDRAANAQTKAPATGGDTADVVKLIDESLAASWKENKVTPAPRSDDYEFLRRASLDVIGRIATTKEIDEFFKDPPANRRPRLVERLLKSEDYAKNWANLWANWLLTRSGAFGRGKYHDETVVWLEEQFSLNKPLNQITTELITASGKSSENGAVNFILAHVGDAVPGPEVSKNGHFEMVPLTSRVSRLFLGIQTQCTQCHDHPFDAKLKQNHFWGINAFLRQVQRDGQPPAMQGNRMMTYPVLTLRDDAGVNADATVYFEKRNGVILPAKAQFLDGTKLSNEEGAKTPVKGKGRREELARLIVEHANYPKALVNRMWGHFFGRGIVHPIDDFNDQNQASHPELLEELGKRYRHYGFDQKNLIRWICNSQAYNLAGTANKTNEKPEQDALFAHMLLKAMAPEQLFESLSVATQQSQSKDAKKKARDTWLDSLISNFGDDEGNEVSFNGTIVQALQMMNGGDLNGAVTAGDGAVAAVVKKRGAGNHRAVIDDLFLLALNRKPTPKESGAILAALPLNARVRDNALAPYQDLLWALLNSNEFMLNH